MAESDTWPPADRVRRVLAVKFGLLGDMFLAEPALRALRQRYPTAHLALLADSPRQTAWLPPDAADQWKYLYLGMGKDTYRRHYDPRLWADMLFFRGAKPFDVLALLNDPVSSYLRPIVRALGWATRAQWRFGLRSGPGELPDQLTGGPLPSELLGCHEIERGWRIAGGTGLVPAPRLPDRATTQAHEAELRHKIQAAGGKTVVVMQPTALRPAKRWPLDRFRELARAVVDRLDGMVILVGSPSERHVGEAFRDLGNRCLPHFDAAFTNLAATMRVSDAFVGHDSGPFHVAVAAGLPTVVLVGPGSPKYFRYPDGNVCVLRRCALGVGDEECPRYLSCTDTACLPSLTVEEVTAALTTALAIGTR